MDDGGEGCAGAVTMSRRGRGVRRGVEEVQVRTSTVPPTARRRGEGAGTPPQARRLQAPSWRDPRLLVGIALVLGSVVVGARTVQAASATSGVWAVSSPVGAGTALSEADLHVVQVSVDPATASAYLPATEPPVAGWVAMRGLSAGELLPRAAVVPADDLAERAVSLPMRGALPEGVRTGALADVWVSWPGDAAPAGSAGARSQPRPEQLAEAVEVVAVRQRSAALAGAEGADVEVLVPQGVLSSVLSALAAEAAVVLVPLPGGSGVGS